MHRRLRAADGKKDSFFGLAFNHGRKEDYLSGGTRNWNEDFREGGNGTSGMSNRTKEQNGDAVDATRDTEGVVAEMAKEGSVKAMDTNGSELGRKGKADNV
ncbi:Uncharacterized protein Fot_48553 [Forsythia ovata]|uniref:Uncharacterized protein n=1 Tax=Forsythia ovata TaxID=205694 RepID=A0ABD1Q9D1_9LAMI